MVIVMDQVAHVRSSGKLWLAVECVALCLGVPLVVATHWIPIPIMPALLLMTIGCWLVLQWQHKIHLQDLLRPRVPAAEWKRILVLFLAAIPCLTAVLWLMNPEAILFLVREHTGFWLLIMFAYPILSVIPQEIIYRAFFFERYRPLFGEGAGMIVASALVFAFGHIVFHNSISVILTFIGGLLFAITYRRTKSLILVAAEHSLYGWAIFTIGYGQYFFDHMLWQWQ